MNWLDLVLLVFAVWRVSYMLVNERGPLAVFEWLRAQPRLMRLLDCIRCVSVYVSFFVSICYFVFFMPTVHFAYVVLVGLAVSGLVCFVDNYFYSMEGTA